MDYKKLADFIFPDITKTIEDYEKEYPERPELSCNRLCYC